MPDQKIWLTIGRQRCRHAEMAVQQDSWYLTAPERSYSYRFSSVVAERIETDMRFNDNRGWREGVSRQRCAFIDQFDQSFGHGYFCFGVFTEGNPNRITDTIEQ